VIKRHRLKLKRDSKSKAKSTVSALPPRYALFGQPHLLAGEDAAAYDQLVERMFATVKPVDFLEEILTYDITYLEWEVLRWRRLKWTVIQAMRLKALQEFLVRQLESNYAIHAEHFKDYLVEISGEAGGRVCAEYRGR
jgi:hypothetical protein